MSKITKEFDNIFSDLDLTELEVLTASGKTDDLIAAAAQMNIGEATVYRALKEKKNTPKQNIVRKLYVKMVEEEH
jgi:hypothetical protein